MLKVLIADDNRAIRRQLSALVTGTGDMEVVGEAADGEEAVALAQSRCPDVVLLDIAMPRVNGLTAARRIRESCPEARIVCLTIYDQRAMKDVALQAGAHLYVEKTALAEEVLAAIRDAAEGAAC